MRRRLLPGAFSLPTVHKFTCFGKQVRPRTGAREAGRYDEEEKIVEAVRWFRNESSRNIGHPGTRLHRRERDDADGSPASRLLAREAA